GGQSCALAADSTLSSFPAFQPSSYLADLVSSSAFLATIPVLGQPPSLFLYPNTVELRNLTPDFLSTILGERIEVRGKRPLSDPSPCPLPADGARVF
ncbi:MAG: hypothetical protein V1736_13425, partial [Pseudomonadota bacterium]